MMAPGDAFISEIGTPWDMEIKPALERVAAIGGFDWPDVSAVSITVVENLNISWGNPGQNSDIDESDDNSGSDDDSTPVVTDIWGKSPEAKRWDRINRPYHPEERGKKR